MSIDQHPPTTSISGPLSRLRLDDLFRSLDDLNLGQDIRYIDTVDRNVRGASSDVFPAASTRHDTRVAVKCIRIHLLENESFAKALEREIRLWSKLDHPNVLPFLGFFLEGSNAIPNLVSLWMENGMVTTYLQKRPFNAAELIYMVSGIAAGLCYLHLKMNIVHGDLKGSNILVSDDGLPLLADFGLSVSYVSASLAGTAGHGGKGSPRWMAKELLALPDARQSQETDMWAFGMVIFELLTRSLPFSKFGEVQVPIRIYQGELPDFEGFDFGHYEREHLQDLDAVRVLAENCWKDKPSERPSANMMLEKIEILEEKINNPQSKSLDHPDYLQLEPDDIASARNLESTNSTPQVRLTPSSLRANELNLFEHAEVAQLGTPVLQEPVSRKTSNILQTVLRFIIAGPIMVGQCVRRCITPPRFSEPFELELERYGRPVPRCGPDPDPWPEREPYLLKQLGEQVEETELTTILERISNLVRFMFGNRNEAKVFFNECNGLCEKLEEARKGGNYSTTIENMENDLVRILNDVRKDIERWSSFELVESLVYQNKITEEIKVYKERLDRTSCELYGRRSSRTSSIQLDVLAIEPDPSRYDVSRLEDRATAIFEFASIPCSDLSRQLVRLASDVNRSYKMQDVSIAMDHAIQTVGNDGIFKTTNRERLAMNLFIISDISGQLRKSIQIPPDFLVFETSQTIAGSTRNDIYKGTFLTLTVAIKKARDFMCVEGSAVRIVEEVANWRLACEIDPKEEFILQLIGVSFPDESFVMISRWMEERDLLTYIKRHGESVKRRHMVKRIAMGLRILHENHPPIAHGHLKASNVIINNNGNPLLSDFGLSKSLENISGQPMAKIQGNISFRWFAPEIVDGDMLVSTYSDIFAFAMTVLELMTGEVPFKEIVRAASVPIALINGVRPERPTDPAVEARGLDDRLWALLNRCWAQGPTDRPDIKEVNDELDAMWV